MVQKAGLIIRYTRANVCRFVKSETELIRLKNNTVCSANCKTVNRF